MGLRMAVIYQVPNELICHLPLIVLLILDLKLFGKFVLDSWQEVILFFRFPLFLKLWQKPKEGILKGPILSAHASHIYEPAVPIKHIVKWKSCSKHHS